MSRYRSPPKSWKSRARASKWRVCLPSASHRKFLPVERYTLGAGVQGGLAGGVAMIAPATMYGLIRFHSLWYAPNLLAAMAIPGLGGKKHSLSELHSIWRVCWLP